MVVGLRTTQQPIDAVIRLSLTSGRGGTVIRDEAPLADWVWSHVGGPPPQDYFLYRRGEFRDVPIRQGTVREERVGEVTDGGWGTYFHPRSSETYELHVEVMKAASGAVTLKPVVKCAEIYTP